MISTNIRIALEMATNLRSFLKAIHNLSMTKLKVCCIDVVKCRSGFHGGYCCIALTPSQYDESGHTKHAQIQTNGCFGRVALHISSLNAASCFFLYLLTSACVKNPDCVIQCLRRRKQPVMIQKSMANGNVQTPRDDAHVSCVRVLS